MASICAVLLTNGRKNHVEDAFHTMIPLIQQCTDGVVVDDSGDLEYREWVAHYTGLTTVAVDENPAGYARAMGTVWDVAQAFDYVLLIEDDFILKAEIDLSRMVDMLEVQPHIQQFVLLRQPWFGNEVEAGGLIPALENIGRTFRKHSTNRWIEHRATWSTNPTLFRGKEWVEAHPWPQQDGSEYAFGQALFAEDSANVCAYWAKHNQDVSVEHIGERKGFGY